MSVSREDRHRWKLLSLWKDELAFRWAADGETSAQLPETMKEKLNCSPANNSERTVGKQALWFSTDKFQNFLDALGAEADPPQIEAFKGEGPRHCADVALVPTPLLWAHLVPFHPNCLKCNFQTVIIVGVCVCGGGEREEVST